MIDLEFIGYKVCGQVFGVRIKLYDSLLQKLMQTFSLMQPLDKVNKRFKFYFFKAIDTDRVTL